MLRGESGGYSWGREGGWGKRLERLEKSSGPQLMVEGRQPWRLELLWAGGWEGWGRGPALALQTVATGTWTL